MGKMTSKKASLVKNLGHAEETTFNALFGDKDNREINHSGASQDNVITDPKYKSQITKCLGKFIDYSVSLKSGKTWQFHLGKLVELSDPEKIKISKNKKGETKTIHSKSFDDQLLVLRSKLFWDKYLGKKSNLLCYNDKQKCYTFFKMDSVTSFLSKNVDWKLNENGRLKGQLKLKSKTYTVLTFEYRVDKKQFNFGANGGQNGLRLFNVLRENVNSCVINFERTSVDNQNQLQVLKKKNITKRSKGNPGDMFFNDQFLFLCIDEKKWKKIELKDI